MPLTIGMSDASNNLAKIAERIVKTGEQVTVFKNNKPYFKMVPLTAAEETDCTNLDTLQAMAEIDAMITNPNHTGYNDFEDFMAALKAEASNV